jgi:hypothetical protein
MKNDNANASGLHNPEQPGQQAPLHSKTPHKQPTPQNNRTPKMQASLQNQLAALKTLSDSGVLEEAAYSRHQQALLADWRRLAPARRRADGGAPAAAARRAREG